MVIIDTQPTLQTMEAVGRDDAQTQGAPTSGAEISWTESYPGDTYL